MFCIIFFKTIPNILLLLFLSPEFNKICLNEERNCIAETNILNKFFEVSFNIYVWWYIYIYWNNTKRFEGSIVYASYTHWYCKLKSRNRNPLCSQNDVGIYSATLSCLVFFCFFYGRAYSLRYRWYTWESSIKRWLYWFCKCIIRWLW